jgi:hypothetical protein
VDTHRPETNVNPPPLVAPLHMLDPVPSFTHSLISVGVFDFVQLSDHSTHISAGQVGERLEDKQ